MRIAYRFVFLNIVEDDRSDNDENELAEEQRLDALARQGIDKLSGPKVLLNGAPANGNGKATGTETRVNGTTNRREPARKA
jgi:very-long-chain ceramide synthase